MFTCLLFLHSAVANTFGNQLLKLITDLSRTLVVDGTKT